MSGQQADNLILALYGACNQEQVGGTDDMVMAAEDARPHNHIAHLLYHQS